MFHSKARNQRCIPVAVIGVDADGAIVTPNDGGDGDGGLG